MARIESLEILLSGSESSKALLKEAYGQVIKNVQERSLAEILKNKNLSGDPTTGTVEVKRLENSASKAYGTARAAGAGDKVKAKPVTIKVDQDKEIVEELENKDIALFGVDGFLENRKTDHVDTMVRELDTAFFDTVADDAGAIAFTPTKTAINDIVEEAILKVQTVKNAFTNGVPRNKISVILSPTKYSELRGFLDVSAQNANVTTVPYEFGYFHGVKVYSSIYLPDDVNGIVYTDGSAAEPVMSKEYTPEKIPLSNAVAVELFYSYGVASVTPDLTAVWKTA